MADDDATADDAQAGDDNGTDDQGSSGDDAGTQDGAGTDDGELDAKALAAEVKALRRENAKRRVEQKALQDKLDADEAAKLSDTDRVKQENERLKAQLAQREADDAKRMREQAIMQVAQAKRAIDPALVAELLVVKLDADDDIGPAVDALLKERPYLKQTDATGSDASGSQSASGATGNGDESDDDRRARIYGGGGNMFDPKVAAKNGGGVSISSPEKVLRRN